MGKKKNALTGVIRHSDETTRTDNPNKTEQPQVTGANTGEHDPVYSATEAAKLCGVSRPTITRRANAGELPGATKTDTGAWQIPHTALVASGMLTDTPTAPADTTKPTDQHQPTNADHDTPTATLEAKHEAELATLKATYEIELATIRGELAAEQARRESAETIARLQSDRVTDLQATIRAITDKPTGIITQGVREPNEKTTQSNQTGTPPRASSSLRRTIAGIFKRK